MSSEYYDDEGFDDWCNRNKDFILEQYCLNIKETEDINTDNLEYKDVPFEFKNEMFEEYLEGDD